MSPRLLNKQTRDLSIEALAFDLFFSGEKFDFLTLLLLLRLVLIHKLHIGTPFNLITSK